MDSKGPKVRTKRGGNLGNKRHDNKCIDLVDLVKCFSTSAYYLLAKIGVDTAESEPSKVSNIIPTQANKFYICIGRCHGKR